jgi:transposase
MSKRSRKRRARARAGSRMEPELQLNDEQWSLIADLFPDPPPSEKGGRPRRTARECVEGILWVLRTGARWRDLPSHFPSPPTCWRRFRAWTEAGVWKVAWARLLRKLDRRGRIHWHEAMADGTFSSAKKGVPALARPNAARAPRQWSSSMAADSLWAQKSPAPVLMK